MPVLPRFVQRRRYTPLALAVLLTLGACGGGGGGDDDDDAPAAAATSSVSGIASKGLLRHAQVVAYRIDGSNEIEVARTRTDANGAYSLSGLPVGALVLVKITAVGATATEPGTTMVDEASDQVIDVPAGLTLRAAAVLSSSAVTANSLHVTPFSEMAVVKAEGSGALTQEKVLAANEDIRRYLNYDPLTATPSFAAAGSVPAASPTNAPALMLAAVSQLASSGGLGCTGTTIARVQCVIQALASSGTHDATVGAALNAAKQAAVTGENYQSLNQPIPADVQLQPEILVPAPQRTAIQNAKLLIDSVRDNARGLEDLGHRLDGVQTSLLDAVQPISAGRVALIQALALATEQLDKYASGAYTGVLPRPANELIEPSLRGSMGVGCTVYSDAGFSVEATTYQNADYVACAITYADVSTGGQRFLYQQRFTVSPRTGVAGGRGYTVTSILARQETALGTPWPGNPANWIGQAQPLSDYRDVVATVTGTGTDLSAVNLQGDLPPTVFEDGGIGTESLSLNVALSVAPLADGSNLSKLSITGLISTVSTATDEELATVGLASGSHVIARLAVPGQVNSEVVDNVASRGHFVLQASVEGGSEVTGTLDVSDYAVSAGGDEWPTKLVFAGQIKEDATTPLFTGTLTLIASSLGGFDPDLLNHGKETAGNFLPKQVGFQGTLHLLGVQPLLINLNLNNATFGSVVGSGSYQQGERTINVQSTHQQESGLWTLTLSGPGGVNVSLSRSAVTSQITANGGVVVGQVNRETGRIDYADSTFESF